MASAESSDLAIDEALQRYVLDVSARLATINHYEVLGVAPTADKATIKRAYFGLAARIHPDRYFGKNLGAFKSSMTAIFARCTQAYETLSNAKKRAEYDAAHPEALTPALGAGRAALPLDPKKAAAQKAAMDALKKRFEDRLGRAKEHATAAERARAAGDLVACVEAYTRAIELAPSDPILLALRKEAEEAAKTRLVESHRKKAQLEARWGRWDDAARSWQSLLTLQPADAEAARGLREALEKRGG
jgi:curved DNA-binding protein CbpA